MEGPYKLLQAEQAQFGDWAGSASRSLYSPSMFYSLFILNEKTVVNSLKKSEGVLSIFKHH